MTTKLVRDIISMAETLGLTHVTTVPGAKHWRIYFQRPGRDGCLICTAHLGKAQSAPRRLNNQRADMRRFLRGETHRLIIGSPPP